MVRPTVHTNPSLKQVVVVVVVDKSTDNAKPYFDLFFYHYINVWSATDTAVT